MEPVIAFHQKKIMVNAIQLWCEEGLGWFLFHILIIYCYVKC